MVLLVDSYLDVVLDFNWWKVDIFHAMRKIAQTKTQSNCHFSGGWCARHNSLCVLKRKILPLRSYLSRFYVLRTHNFRLSFQIQRNNHCAPLCFENSGPSHLLDSLKIMQHSRTKGRRARAEHSHPGRHAICCNFGTICECCVFGRYAIIFTNSVHSWPFNVQCNQKSPITNPPFLNLIQPNQLVSFSRRNLILSWQNYVVLRWTGERDWWWRIFQLPGWIQSWTASGHLAAN